MKVVKLRSTVSQCARTDGAYARPDARPGTSGPSRRSRQCGRTGLPATTSQRQNSRASARVAWSQATPAARTKRNQRSKSKPYDRIVGLRPPRRLQMPEIGPGRFNSHACG